MSCPVPDYPGKYTEQRKALLIAKFALILIIGIVIHKWRSLNGQRSKLIFRHNYTGIANKFVILNNILNYNIAG